MGKQSLNGFSPTDLVDDPMTIIATQGAFYGASLPAQHIEGLIAGNIPKKHITEVSDCFASRWWDYRRLSPGHSFYYFAHCYYEGAQRTSRKLLRDHLSTRSGTRAQTQEERKRLYQFVGPALNEMDISQIWDREPSHITGLWKAMLVADALGMPYPEYVKLTMRIAIDRMWTRLPQPTQLYSEDLAARVMDEWDALRPERLTVAKHPIYEVENYVGTPLQDEYREWLIEELKQLRSDLIPALMQVMYVTPQLPLDLAQQHFPQQALNRARLLVN